LKLWAGKKCGSIFFIFLLIDPNTPVACFFYFPLKAQIKIFINAKLLWYLNAFQFAVFNLPYREVLFLVNDLIDFKRYAIKKII